MGDEMCKGCGGEWRMGGVEVSSGGRGVSDGIEVQI